MHLEPSGSEHDQGASLDDFDAAELGLFRQVGILSPGVEDDPSRLSVDDLLDQRRGASRSHIHGHGVNRVWHIADPLVASLAENLFEIWIDRNWTIAVLPEALHCHEG